MARLQPSMGNMTQAAARSDGFTSLVGVALPLQQAGMTRVTTPTMAAAVGNAGGLGMLAPGKLPLDVVAREIDHAEALTSAPLGATFLVRYTDRDVLAMVAERVAVVEFFYEWPDPTLILPGVISGWQVGTVDEARAAVEVGCSFVIAQGLEAGGHVRGVTPLRDLLPAVRAAVDVPVVAAGGLGSAADVARAFDMGADAVRIGTRFVASIESDAHPSYVAALIAANAEDAVLTDCFDVGWPEAPHRVLASSIAAVVTPGPDPVAHVPMPGGIMHSVVRRGTTPPNRETVGQLDAMALYAGRSVGAVTRRQSVAEIVRELLGPASTRR